MIGIMHLTKGYHWSKGSLEWIVKDVALGNLAAADDREESASHHSTASMVTPWYHLKLPGSILRTLMFRIFSLFSDSLSVVHGFRSSTRSRVDTIGKSVKNHGEANRE